MCKHLDFVANMLLLAFAIMLALRAQITPDAGPNSVIHR